jgi:hypothetical protein
VSKKDGALPFSALGHRRPEGPGRSLTVAEMCGDLVCERMRSDVSRSGIVIDILVKWVALTFCCQIESVLGVFWTVSVFLTRHGEGFSKQPKHRKHATRLVVSDSDRDNIHFRAKAVSRGEKLELRLLSKA